MGTREHLDANDPYAEATLMELWGAGELDDEDGSPGISLTLTAVTGLLVALAVFFVTFAPGA